MSDMKTGGSAFPAQPIQIDKSGSRTILEQGGMSVRDYFASAAMKGMVSGGSDFVGFLEANDWTGVARLSYQIADAMIAERDKS